jgi:hypothetical protein
VLTLVVGLLGLVSGPLVGALMLLGSDASFDVVELASALVYTLTIPVVAIARTYLYFDSLVRDQLDERGRGDEALPSEIETAGRIPG